MNAVCAKHPKILLIAPTDPVALRPAIQTCLNAGVKVVTVDTALSNTSGLVSAISSDNIQGGKSAAGVIGKQLKGHGQVAVFSIDGTTTTQVERIKGLKEGLAHYPGISVVSSQFTGQPETVSETDTKAVMTSHPQVKALFGAAETNAEGAAQALSSMGDTGKLTVVGYDADPSAVSLLKSGAISALVIQQPALEGQLGVRVRQRRPRRPHLPDQDLGAAAKRPGHHGPVAAIRPSPSTTTRRLLTPRRPGRPARPRRAAADDREGRRCRPNPGH